MLKTMPASDDRMRMAALYLLGSFIKKKAKVPSQIDEFILRVVDDLEVCRSYPWGRYSFEHCSAEIASNLDNLKGIVKAKNSLTFGSFLTPLEILAYEAIDVFKKKYREDVISSNDCPRMCKSRFKKMGMKGYIQSMLGETLGETKEIHSFLQPSIHEEQLLIHIWDDNYPQDTSDEVAEAMTSHLNAGRKIFWQNFYQMDVSSREAPPAHVPPIVPPPPEHVPPTTDLLRELREYREVKKRLEVLEAEMKEMKKNTKEKEKVVDAPEASPVQPPSVQPSSPLSPVQPSSPLSPVQSPSVQPSSPISPVQPPSVQPSLPLSQVQSPSVQPPSVQPPLVQPPSVYPWIQGPVQGPLPEGSIEPLVPIGSKFKRCARKSVKPIKSVRMQPKRECQPSWMRRSPFTEGKKKRKKGEKNG